MRIKTDDKVKIMVGKDKGKIGKVLQVFSAEKKVVVEGLNLMIKNQRARRQGEKGQRIQFPAPLAVAKVALICPKCGQATKVGRQIIRPTEKGQKTIKNRVCKKCKEII